MVTYERLLERHCCKDDVLAKTILHDVWNESGYFKVSAIPLEHSWDHRDDPIGSSLEHSKDVLCYMDLVYIKPCKYLLKVLQQKICKYKKKYIVIPEQILHNFCSYQFVSTIFQANFKIIFSKCL